MTALPMHRPALSASASPPYTNHSSTGGGKDNFWSPDHLIPLLAVIAAHLGLIAWVTHVSMQNQPLLALPVPVMTGILIAPPVPKPVAPPPTPHVVHRPVVHPPPPKPKPQIVKPPPVPTPPPKPAVDPVPVPKPAPPPVVTEAPPPPAFTAPPAEVKKPAPAPPPVIPPRVDASQLNNPIPPYPSISRRLGEEGKVLLDVDILPDGTVGEIKVKSSSGYPRLDQAALEAVRRWRYVPASRGGQPISYWYVQPIVFSLRD